MSHTKLFNADIVSSTLLSSPIGGASISYFKNFCPAYASASASASAYSSASACHLVFPNDNS